MVSVLSARKIEGEDPKDVRLPEHVYLGRQPILNGEEKLWAYEILYRDDGHQNQAQFADPQHATSTVVMNMIAELGVERVVGNHRMFINCPAETLHTDLISLLPRERVILEVSLDVAMSERRVAELARVGFRIAIHGSDGAPIPDQLLDLASFVKFDVSKIPANALQQRVRGIADSNTKLIAEKVETHSQMEQCKAAGFDLFQGYFFCRPEIVKGRRAPANQMAVMQLLRAVSDPDSNRDDLTKIISDEVSLSFRLLRTLNSAAFGFRREVETIEHAVTLLGEVRLREWASMLAVSEVPGKPSELSRVALLRGLMCQEIANLTRKADPATAFTVGLFSVLDTMMDRKMLQLLKELPFSKDIKQALLQKKGPLTDVLQAVLKFEEGNGDAIVKLGVRTDQLTALWIECSKQMEDSFRYMTG